MASLIDITCPECKKQMKAPEELQGKKIRCKGCGHVFNTPAPGKPRSAADDEDDANPYGILKEDEGVARCPNCAGELESADARLCLHCGYDTVTRKRLGTKKVIESTQGDHFAWMLPGILCIVGIVLLIGFDLFYCFGLPRILKGGENEWLASGFFRLWLVIGSAFVIAYMGKFAYNRLIVNPKPPEIEREI